MKKIKKLFNDLKISFNEMFKFDFIVGVYEVLYSFLRKTKLSIKIHKKKHDRVKKILYKRNSDLINKLNSDFKYNDNVIGDTKNIFIMWYQGINNAPLVVKKCISTIKKNYSDYNIVILDSNNLSLYGDIPQHIYDLLKRGEITFTHFSDIVRFEVLYRNGGIWIDSTCFVTKEMNLEKRSLFTIKHNLYSDWHVCKGLWTGFFIGASKNNGIIEWYRNFFYYYWKNNKVLPCYFFIDCVMAIAYETNDFIRKKFDELEINNTGVFELSNKMNSKYDEEWLNKIKEETSVFKLTYKSKYNINETTTTAYHILGETND